MRFGRTHRLLLGGAALSAVLGAFLVGSVVSRPTSIAISTATEGGTYAVLGQQLARILEGMPDVDIATVELRSSGGSTENIDRLLGSDVELAFATRHALTGYTDEQLDQLRVLARLYSDILQIVVRADGPDEPEPALRGKRIALGPEGSGTRKAAERLLQVCGVSRSDYVSIPAESFEASAHALLRGAADVAVFSAGTPTAAIRKLLRTGEWSLLDLGDTDVQIPGYVAADVPAFSYENQPVNVKTWGTDVYLLGHRDLDEDVAFATVKAIFENLKELLDVHQSAQHMKLTTAFDDARLPHGLALHDGVSRFVSWVDETLLIATGAMSGKYYEIGRTVKRLLETHGVESFVVHTDGSIENAAILASGRPTLAIMQYDTALAAHGGVAVYDFDPLEATDVPEVPEVRGLRRLAALHEDRVHVFGRRAALARIGGTAEATLDDLRDTLRRRPLKAWLGPEQSGSRILSQAILQEHGIHLGDIEPQFMPDADMLVRYYSGDIDVGFFASHVPSQVLRPIVDDPDTVLISMSPKARAGLVGAALAPATIEPGTYACQRDSTAEVQTLSTRALLVTTDAIDEDVRAITEAIFEGEAFLQIPGGRAAMARDVPSLPLHTEAEAYYRAAGHLPAQPTLASSIFDWLSVTWRTLAILVIFVAAARGVMEIKHERTADEFYKRALAPIVAPANASTVQELLTIRDQLNERVMLQWWNWGALDRGRWRPLHDLINDFVSQEKEDWGRALLAEARAVVDATDIDASVRQERLRKLERRIWQSIENGTLDSTQQGMLKGLLAELRADDSRRSASVPD